MEDKILVHHGVDGQKWGTRKYQYEDGSLTPLGREHYGVGDPRSKSENKIKEYKAKAKAEAKIIKAKAKAEAIKTKAKVEAYKEKKKADDEVELEKIRAQREIEKGISKENKDIAKMEQDTNRKFIKSGESSSNEKLVTGLKVAGAVLAVAGIGYLTYRALNKGKVEGVSKETEEKGASIISQMANTPTSEITSKATETASKATKAASKATKAASKASKTSYYFTPSGEYAKEVSRGSKLSDWLFGPVTTKTAPRSVANKATQEFIKSGSKAYQENQVKGLLDKAMGSKDARKATEAAQKAAVRSNWEAYIEKLKKVSLKHSEVLVHMYNGDAVICHHGIKGQKWGVIRKLDDSKVSGRQQDTPTGRASTERRVLSY